MKVLTAFVLTLCTVSFIYGQSQESDSQNSETAVVSDDFQELNSNAKKHLLLLIKIGERIKDSESSSADVSKIRVIKSAAPVYQNRYDTTSFIRNVNLNEDYELLNDDNNFYEILLSANQKAWIRKSDASWVKQGEQFSKVSKAMKNEYHELELIAHRTYNSIISLEKELQEKVKKSGGLDAASLKQKKKFDQYIQNAKLYYQRNFEAYSPGLASVSLQDKISGSLTVSGGLSRFKDVYSDGTEQLFKGGVGEISLQMAYQIDPKSNVDLRIGNNIEILGSPYRATQFHVGYNKRTKSTSFSLNTGLDAYKDKSLGINSYNRFNLGGVINHAFNKKSNLDFRYTLMHNNYKDSSVPDYTQNNGYLGIRNRFSDTKSLRLGLTARHSASKRSDFKFIHLIPEFTISNIKGKSKTDYSLGAEIFKYNDLPLRTFNRARFNISNTRKKGNFKSVRTDAQMSYTLYPDNDVLNHLRLNFGRTLSKFQSGTSQVGFGLTSKYFNKNKNASYTDLRLDMNKSKAVYTSLSAFTRFWFPNDGISLLAEANFKFGVKIKAFKLGPSISVRTNILSDNFSFKTDGNNYRLGGFFEGTQKIANKLSWYINTSASYNGVYSQDFTVDATGLISPGQVTTRHPITIYASTRFIYDVKGMFDVFTSLDYYNVKQDFSANPIFNTVDKSNRITIKLGFTYKYNQN